MRHWEIMYVCKAVFRLLCHHAKDLVNWGNVTIARLFTQTQNLTLKDQVSSVIVKNRSTIVHFKKKKQNQGECKCKSAEWKKKTYQIVFLCRKTEIRYTCKYLFIKVTLEDTFKGYQKCKNLKLLLNSAQKANSSQPPHFSFSFQNRLTWKKKSIGY